MKLTVEIPDDLLEEHIRDYLEGMLRPPSYAGAKGGVAWEWILALAKEEVAALDLRPVVERAIRATLHETVATVVTAEIKRQAGAQAKLLLMAGHAETKS